MKLRQPLWHFGLLIIAVVVIQFLLLEIILQFGFTSDDWWILFDYKIYGANLGFLDKYSYVLSYIGLHHTYQIFYVGILESLFRGNYQLYQLTNILFKILATISLYPLILIVFKRRLLAFLTTILFAISYSSTGGLLFVCTGSDYLALFFMNIFLISYYYYFLTKQNKFFFLAVILLFFSFILSPIRMYPLLGFVILIEVFIWVRLGKLLGFVQSLKRLILLFFPFLIIYSITRGSTVNYLGGPAIVFDFISQGNYQLFLPPFAGLGYTILTNDYWYIFGNLNLDSFKDYLIFLIQGPIIIYSLLTIFISSLITKKRMRTALALITTNVLFQIACYFLITSTRGMSGENIKGFYPVSVYAIFLGFFIISVGFAGLISYFKNRSNLLLLSLFVGPIFSSVFVWGTWLIKGDVLTFKEGIHWYMVTIAMGTYLFLATLMVFAFDKIKAMTQTRLKYFFMVLLFLLILPTFLLSRKVINETFSHLLSIGYKASDQEEAMKKFIGNIKVPLNKSPRLFYFTAETQKFYPVSLLDGFEERMHFQNWELVDGCVGLVYDRKKLENSVVVKDGVKGFKVSSMCVRNSFETGREDIFYAANNLYAFRLKDREVIDIKEEVLKSLGF